MRPDPRAVLVALLVAGLASCTEAPDWRTPTLPGDSLEFPTEDDSPAEEGTLAERQQEHRAMAAVDSLFPHSEHRTVECQRCHQRPSGHATHGTIDCRQCHGQPVQFASLPERSPRECASCHHGDVPRQACQDCHPRDEVGARPVLVAVQAVGATEARVRSLTFDHDDHRSRECLTCHTREVTLRYGRECASCHEYHHRQDARCMTCHVDVRTEAHSGNVHAGCAGGGCHGEAAVLQLAPERNVCQVCHQDLVDHRPGQECTQCHIGFGDNLRQRATGGRR